MGRRVRHGLLFGIVLLTFSTAATIIMADSILDATRAYTSGDYAIAIRLYRSLAETGDFSAQSNLGAMFQFGQGVKQDNVKALMWFSIAASNGYTNAELNRNSISGNMMSWQIELAEDMARTCIRSSYKQCGDDPSKAPAQASRSNRGLSEIQMQMDGGTYVIPVQINGAITLDFVVDSGAADVSIPADVVMTLMRTRTLNVSDFLGQKTYVLADGSKVPSQTFRIRSLKVGDRVLENVSGSVASVQGSLLLGQSFLSRFKSWSVDNAKHALIFD
jgi:clan AA aspartic protease (TIGR02281 family)